MRKIIIYKLYLASLTIVLLGLSSQVAICQSNKETAAQMVEIGDEIFNQTLAVMEARDLYLAAVNMDRDNVRAHYMAGVTTLQSIDKGSAKQYFLRVLELDPEYSFDILYKIGQAYHYDYEFDDAINYYSRYKQKLDGTGTPPGPEYATAEEVERKLYECEQGKIMVEFPENVEIGNVGPEINSDKADYAPVVNQDENLLIFTSRRQIGNLNPDVASDNYPYEDIYISTKTGSTWSEAKNIGEPINTLYHDSNVGLSKDGTTLYIYKDDNEGDIFEAKRDVNGKWSEPVPMGKPVNTEYSETSVSLTPDGETMFFASNRKGGMGGLDIWITHKNKKGNWDDPVNLGDEINTAYNEDGPFIGFDSKTLYFSSAGGEGMGGYDIYRVSYDSSSATWGAPENMGYPINTPDHDIYFVPSKDGKDAYYSSVRDDGYGASDIYMLKIPEVLQHQEQVEKPKVTLKVHIYDDKSKLTDAVLQLTETGGDSRLYAARNATGEYSFVSSSTEVKQYNLSIENPGFESLSVSIAIPAVGEESTTIEKSVTLVRKAPPPPPKVTKRPATTGNKLRNIYFDFNKSKLKSEYQDKVNKAVAYLKANPGVKILLVGHSDLIGAEKYNKGLSQRRAEVVKKAMVAQGIASSRIQTKGEGAKFPLASNDQEKEGRELNRRVEFKIIR
jgi:outer membrane protein OmpA-like peptidoglycan-associated protein